MARPDLCAIDNNVNPRDYLDRIYFDSLVHEPLMLEYIIGLFGAERIALGSDYPFPLGDLEVGKFIEDMDLEKCVKEDIFHNAALEWLDVPKERFA